MMKASEYGFLIWIWKKATIGKRLKIHLILHAACSRASSKHFCIQLSWAIFSSRVVKQATSERERVKVLNIIIFFEGFDSPSAWAVEEHGPLLLSDETIKTKVLSSGDATCLLLRSNHTTQENMCQLVNDESLGSVVYLDGRKLWDQPQLLSEQGVVKVMGCLRGTACVMENPWLYDGDSRLLKMEGRKATISVASLLKQIGTMTQEEGLAVLTSLQAGISTKNSSKC